MNLLVISLLVVASTLTLLPTNVIGATSDDVPVVDNPLHKSHESHETHDQDSHPHGHDHQQSDVLEEPHVLALSPATASGPAAVAAIASPAGEIWQEDDREVLIRNERGANNNNNNNGGKKGKNKKNKDTNANTKQTQTASCRYVKSPWTECDAKSNTRSRTLTLKKGELNCVPTRTIQKKCKKACRYEKGVWSECAAGQMSRSDKIKSTSDLTCQATRVVNKNCNPAKSKGEKVNNKEGRPAKTGNKDKVGRKSRA